MTVSYTGVPVAGYPYTLTCTIDLTEGVSGSLQIRWIDSNGQQLLTGDNIVVGPPVISSLTTNLTLTFKTLRLTDEGVYTCNAILSSPADSLPVNSSVSHFIDVLIGERMFICKFLQLPTYVHSLAYHSLIPYHYILCIYSITGSILVMTGI